MVDDVQYFEQKFLCKVSNAYIATNMPLQSQQISSTKWLN